jgi:hypothetical protein
MISATDSFVQYLSVGLANNPAVKWVRRSANDPTSHLLKHNTLNFSALQYMQIGSKEEILVSLDLIGDDERQVVDWAKLVRDKLIEQQYTSELDYEANPASPVTLGRFVEWDGRAITFDIVTSDANSVHLNATFSICHVRQ